MKKITVITLICLVGQTVSAQTSSPTQGVKTTSTEESKKYNGNVETMMNGKPYSQYATEQNIKPAAVAIQENNTGTLGTQKPTVIAATTKTEAKQPGVNSTNTGLTIPASENKVMNSKESNSLTGDIVQPKPSNAVKTVKSEVASEEGKPAANNLTVTMVPVGSDAIAPTVVQPAVKTVLPEVKIDSNAAPMKMEEVPPSVDNPEVKKPEVKMQGTKGQQ